MAIKVSNITVIDDDRVGIFTGVDSTGIVDIQNSTGATSTATGALVVDGGAGIAENLYVGNTIFTKSLVVEDFNLVGLTVESLSTGDILIKDNFITTTLSNSDLELNAAGTGTIELQTNTNITGALDVSSQATFASANIEDLTAGRVVLAGALGELQDSVNLTFDGTELTVTGDATVTGTLTVKSLIVEDFNTLGITVESLSTGDILIKDNFITTTLSNSDLEINAAGTGTIELQTDTNVTGNLTVTDTITTKSLIVEDFNLVGLTVESISTGDILIKDNFITTTLSNSDLELDAAGTGTIELKTDTNVTGTLDVSVQANLASARVEDLTSGRVVLVGASGELQDSANLTFNGTTLAVTGNVDVTGDITLGGNIRIGDQNVDTVTVIADFTSDLVPDSSNRFNLGLDSKRWNVVYADAFNADQIEIKDNKISTVFSNANLELDAAGTGSISFLAPTTGLFGDDIQLGTNTLGDLTTEAGNFSSTTTVTDSVAVMNEILGKLIPDAPPTFPGGQSIAIQSLSTYRMTNFVQTDNTATGSKNVAGGATVTNVRRSNTYTTNYITTVGPGTTGTVAAYKNGVLSGSRAMTSTQTASPGGIGSDNGTFTDLQIANDQDYFNVSSSNPNVYIIREFWQSFDVRANGTVSQGWNEVYLTHSLGTNTNTPFWYYDASTPGTPEFSNTSITPPGSPGLTYSSTVPHYNSSTSFTIQFNINRLSGDMYPTTDNFATGTAGGAFLTPTTVTYTGAGITTPLTRNLHVTSGSALVTTTSAIRTGFGSSSAGPTIDVSNSYATGTNTFSPGAIVLYKTGTSNQIEETSIPVTSVGTGSGNAFRIENPDGGTAADTPSVTLPTVAFNSQSSTLRVTDATVVAAVLKHDVTNYSTGYLPAGPNLSSGRTGSQYFTFKFVRTAVSKFNIRYTGTIAGLWIALPGSTIDSTSTLNGWLDVGTPYAGAGIPGANTGNGGNGSDGCAVGGVAVFNSAQTNKSVTATFGTVSSTSTATNEILVRVELTSGQTVTAIDILTATN